MATTMHWLPNLARRVSHHLGVIHRGGIDADLVGTGIEQAAHVIDGAHATTDGKRDEDLLGHLLDHVQDDVAVVGAGGDVEEGDLVGALFVVAAGDLHRITGVPQFDEIDALDDTAGTDVEAGNDALGEHGSVVGLRQARRRGPGPRRNRGCLRRWPGR
jgi:hypothetical protein